MMAKKSNKRELYYGGDNLAVMRGLESKSVDLIYLDPPFNSKSIYKGAMGSKAAKQQFKDIWRMSDINNEELEDLKLYAPDIHSLISILGGINGESWQAYLTFMAVRLMEMRRLLKPTGSIYLHCDATMSAPLKLLMDMIFGRDNFRNEIIWKRYRGKRSGAKYKYSAVVDSIFYYGMSKEAELQTPFNPLRDDYVRTTYKHDDGDGLGAYRYGGRIRERKYYLNNSKGIPVTNLWDDVNELNGTAEEATGWATQKPLALLKRIIKASSNPGDIVLDPFCGCATACVAAEEEGRAWIGIDKDKETAKIMKGRTKGQQEFDTIWDCVKLVNASKIKMLPVREEIRAVKIPKNQWQKMRTELYKRQKGKCAAAPDCPHELPLAVMEVDRITAGAHGGQYVIGNVQLLCPRCNRMKGKDTMDELKNRLEKKRFE